MRIALTADPEIPVPPVYYGGIERIVDMLAKEYHERGHEVTVFAHPDSTPPGRHVAWAGRCSQSKSDTARNSMILAWEVLSHRYDIVHSFSRIAYLAPILPLRIPKIMTYQRAISPRSVRLGHMLSGGTLEFTAISQWMMEPVQNLGRWHVVPNGVPLETYTFQPTVKPDAPLVFLGRIEEIKGPHLAIEVAKRSHNRLIIAGNVPDEKRPWFDAYVAPHIDDRQIQYIGPVDDARKNALLGEAKAFLMPILWDEPFGIVMAEAMACGTPVIGFRRGAVSEVVEDDVTGFIVNNIEDMISSVMRLENVSRSACRRRVDKMYSATAVANGYLLIYAQMQKGNI
jgi:glycosyltransferase involved in cell wall biosynthesis